MGLLQIRISIASPFHAGAQIQRSTQAGTYLA